MPATDAEFRALRLAIAEVGYQFSGPGGDEYTVRAVLSPTKMIAQNMVSDELVGFAKEKASDKYWNAVRYFGLKEYPGFSSNVPNAIRRFTAVAKPTRKKKASWTPDSDFDLTAELEQGWTIAQGPRGGFGVGCAGRYKATLPSLDAAVEYIEKEMKRDGYYPGIFVVNERGNVDLLAIRTVRGKTVYSVQYSWV